MAQATFSIRMDENLKSQFDALCREFGMNTSTAINIFAHAVVRERRIPFEIYAPAPVTLEEGKNAFEQLRQSAKENAIQDLTLDEINVEIEEVRKNRR